MASISNDPFMEDSSSSLTMFGGSESSGKSVKGDNSKRAAVLRQLAALDEAPYVTILGHFKIFCASSPVSKKTGARSTAATTRNKLSRLMVNISTVLSEYVGNAKGGVNAVVNLKSFEEEAAADLMPSELDAARQKYMEPVLDAVTKSFEEVMSIKKARTAPLKPNVPAAYAPSAFTQATLPSSSGFLEYEQPLSTWDHDTNMLPELDTALHVTPLKKTSAYKFVLVAIDSECTEADVRKAVEEACDNAEVQITGVEFFTDLVANKQRRHAFVSVNSLSQLQAILNDRVRAFGVHINGQRSSIVDVEEKNIISVMMRPALDAERIEILLKDLGIMALVNKDSAAPSQPLVSSYHLNTPRTNRFSIFAPRDGNGDLIGKAWISFPTHASAYAAYNSLVQARPGSIRAFWSQKSPNHFEEAIRLRDALAAENAELRQKVKHLSSSSSTGESSQDGEDENNDNLSLDSVIQNHVVRVLNSARGDLSQASQMLQITENVLKKHIRKIRDAGFEVDVQ